MSSKTLKLEQPDLQQLENQLCFPLYACSRLVTRLYQPLLEPYGLTYPQYIILLILWQHEQQTVKQIGEKALLNSNTLTPLLKRMQQSGLVERQRSEQDERQVNIALTDKGKQLKVRLACLPQQLMTQTDIELDEVAQLKQLLDKLLLKLK